jgi:hypothetical protein
MEGNICQHTKKCLHENWSLFCSIMDSPTRNPFIYEEWMACFYVKWISIDLGLQVDSEMDKNGM